MKSLIILAAMGICLIFVSLAQATEATLFWNAPAIASDNSDAPDGYRVHLGTEPGVYPDAYDAGNKLYYTFDLPPGTHYAVVSAYNSAGESGLSTEASVTMAVIKVIPGIPTTIRWE